MLELIFAGFVVATAGGLARRDGRSEGKWAGICAGLVLLSLLIPIPFIRLGIAFAATFGLMMMEEKEA